ncbi:hypothetical protein TNCT_438481 [Trichonephila clavata]|uniref:YqaJ viral recombinase domain-containing protein n=1 Tax=Trichonephila clavata TaxID=2740835 RepID=A0A8X6JDN6_TRICU|nr:hypothetical protein TNCT_438481 [Trichonephila clavata]
MRIVYDRDLCNAAMKYGLANEEIARKQYEKEYETEVKICGLFVDKDKPFLCASPDGLVGDDELIRAGSTYGLNGLQPRAPRVLGATVPR